jgi:hypothetical protein
VVGDESLARTSQPLAIAARLLSRLPPALEIVSLFGELEGLEEKNSLPAFCDFRQIGE